MKKVILPIFALSALSVFAEKTNYVIDKASDYKTNPFPVKTTAEFDIYYTAAAGGNARMGNVSGNDYTPISLTFKGAGYTVDGMTSTNPVNWNLLGEFYFTLDATKGEQTIITNETSAYIYNQTNFISVKADSTGGSPSAFIDLGASYWVNTGGKSASAQLPGFDIQADTTIGTTAENYSEEYMVTFERRSRLNVSNNATLTIEGGTKYAYAPGDTETKTSPTINVAEGSTLYLKGAKNLVGADVSFTVNGTLKLGDNASFETTSTALKTTINNLSTGTMVKMGRVSGNWMSWVSISNKKLIDRGIRLISELGRIPYAEAAERLFFAEEWIESKDWTGKETPCAVQVALENLKSEKAK